MFLLKVVYNRIILVEAEGEVCSRIEQDRFQRIRTIQPFLLWWDQTLYLLFYRHQCLTSVVLRQSMISVKITSSVTTYLC